MSLPLSDLVVFEMGGLAPAPYAGMILSDFGADVIRIDRPKSVSTDVLARNKRSISVNMKNPAAVPVIRELLKKGDILLDPYRPGVLEKMGLGPDVLLKDNPRLIIARLSGYGQSGPASEAAGHDINYISVAGALGMMGRKGERPMFPLNILADFAGGGLMCVMGILMALMERSKSGKGQVVDANLAGGTSYLTTFPFLMQKYGLNFNEQRGTNMLDSGAPFYEVYKTKDDRYMSVGAIEPQFYAQLLQGLGLDPKDLPEQHDREHWTSMKETFARVFASKTQAVWTEIFDGTDACVAPVLSFQEEIPNVSMVTNPAKQWPRKAAAPQPAPILSRTPAKQVNYDDPKQQDDPFLQPGTHTMEVLSQFGVPQSKIRDLLTSGAFIDTVGLSKL
ncbi:CoA-transferase family III domain-containing protein [Phascolomyces articulosus]|uniref:CoA-transferase family III domain-containing protein n=1 Tax=Phascolomyces articulosus TaxID=60185 RepID=A0AAD5K6P0_9FUNG|nr:CoA-transferase family III domain-containing protein [Phascolomyces articulosus]